MEPDSIQTSPVPKKNNNSSTLFTPLDFQVWMWTSPVMVHHLLFRGCLLAFRPPTFYTCSGLAVVYHRSFVSSIKTLLEDGLDVGCKCLVPSACVATRLFVFLFFLFVFSWCPSLFSSPSVLVETVQNNPALLVESNFLVALQNQDNFMETSIPVPTLNWQDVSNKNSGFAECV